MSYSNEDRKLNGNHKIPPRLKFISRISETASKIITLAEDSNGDTYLVTLFWSQSEEEDKQIVENMKITSVISNNDVHNSFTVNIPQISNAKFKVTILKTVIDPYSYKKTNQTFRIVFETPEKYAKIVDTVKTLPPEKWVTNLLSGAAEANRILAKTDGKDGMLLAPSIKVAFDPHDSEAAKKTDFLIFAYRTDIKSLRDLKPEHIPFLKKMVDFAANYLHRTFGWYDSQIKSFFHYHPSTWHLHLHITHVDFDDDSSDTIRSHLVLTIINNLTIDPNYYIKASIPIRISPQDRFYKMMA